MTIADVARLADVSKACVSRFFNHGYVSEEKKERIRSVIAETGYTPGRSCVNRMDKRRTVGVILPRIESESISRMAAGISQVLCRENVQMLLANTENSVEKEIEYLRVFQRQKVDGIIFIATILTEAHWQQLQEMRMPIVVLGQCVDRYSCVYHNDYGAAKAMTDLMIARGCRKIGAILVTCDDYAAGEERRNGYLDALFLAGLPIEENRIVYSAFTLESGYEAAERLLTQQSDLDGLFCATDTIAMGAIQYLKGIGKRIPEDICVTGIGHSHMTEIITPQLTTVHFFYKTTGAEGAEILLKILKTGVDMKKKLKLGFEIVEQQSTGGYPERI